MSRTGIDETHDPALASWVPGADGHVDFPVQNLPLGVFSPAGGAPRAGVAIGDHILDLAGIAASLPEAAARCVQGTTLNALLALPAADRVALRRRLSALLCDEARQAQLAPLLHDRAACRMHLPCRIGDYTDFYVGIHHAVNVGRQFRPDHPLLDNYKWVPIGYHGRASSVRVPGSPIVRPYGQRRVAGSDAPEFAATRRLDYELELGIWIGGGNTLGAPVPIDAAAGRIAGVSLLNDWSARDMQAWEYQPLGPFLAKSFHTTVSPWIVTAEALAPFRVAQPARPAGDPRPLPYLWHDHDQRDGAMAIDLEVAIRTARMREAGEAPFTLSRSSSRHMYWTIAQMVTHHASNGCDLRSGDLLGTGTISAPGREGCGSILETTMGGSEPVTLPGGETRAFLEDGDEVTLRGRAHAVGFVSIGFGDCTGIVHPASPTPGTSPAGES